MELIDGASFIDAVRKSGFADEIKDQIIFMAEIQPIVDAVPVVRCKFCQNYYIKNSRVGLCMDKNDMFVQAEDYCSDGRRYYESKD